MANGLVTGRYHNDGEFIQFPSNGGINLDTSTHGRQLVDIKVVARKCCCSEQHIRRLCDAGKMPQPIRLGRVVRWDLAEIDEWKGCPAIAVPSKPIKWK